MMQTSWPWRHTLVHLNYSDFTVVYNTSGRHGTEPSLCEEMYLVNSIITIIECCMLLFYFP